MKPILILTLVGCTALLAQQLPASSNNQQNAAPSTAQQEGSPQPPLSSTTATSPQAPKERVYRPGNGVTPPIPIKKPNPKYTEEARQAKYQGSVLLWLIVTPEGLPTDIKVTGKLEYGLTEKAIEAARKWRFKPATLNGHPVAVQINIQMDFRLY